MASPWLLAFDTSTPRSVIVLGKADSSQPQVADARTDGANQASSTLVPRIQAVVEQAGLAMQDVAAIVCGCGPGTFTGTRVGVATAKGLSLGLGCPLYACSSLLGIAASTGARGPILATLDARRKQVYAALFEVEEPAAENIAIRAHRLSDEVCADLGDLFTGSDFDVPAGTTLAG
ncbi:MAG: tRNA (adenosine(37)-N6)-threonylcarbamoyltransferase complex dimerization subunit type 1 TsaB, partial [Nannocystaceae bacterium]